MGPFVHSNPRKRLCTAPHPLLCLSRSLPRALFRSLSVAGLCVQTCHPGMGNAVLWVHVVVAVGGARSLSTLPSRLRPLSGTTFHNGRLPHPHTLRLPVSPPCTGICPPLSPLCAACLQKRELDSTKNDLLTLQVRRYSSPCFLAVLPCHLQTSRTVILEAAPSAGLTGAQESMVRWIGGSVQLHHSTTLSCVTYAPQGHSRDIQATHRHASPMQTELLHHHHHHPTHTHPRLPFLSLRSVR